MQKKRYYSSIKYVLLSFNSLWFLLYLGFSLCASSESWGLVTVMLIALWVPMHLIGTKRMYYLVINNDKIVMKHPIFLWYRKSFPIADIRRAGFSQESFGGRSNPPYGHETYIKCFVIYFNNPDRKKKIYWASNSFYPSYQNAIYHQLHQVIPPRFF